MQLPLSSLFLIAALAAPGVALAQDAAGLHFARSGAMLGAADEDTKILFAVVTAKVFDVELTKTVMSDLKKALGEARGSAFRASQLLEDQKASGEVAKLDDAIKTIEASFQKLDADIKAETKDMKIDEDNPDIAPAAGAKAPEEGAGKVPDWELLKNDIGTVYADIGAAKSLHGKLSKVVKAPALKAPPAPKKK